MAVMWWMPSSCMGPRLLGDQMIARATIPPRSGEGGTAARLRASRLGERLAAGAGPQLVQRLELLLPALDQAAEPIGVELRHRVGNLAERPPQRQLAAHPRDQPLELDHAAQRRVAGEPAVQLESPRLLGDPEADVLGAVGAETEVFHDALERAAIGLDVVCQLGQLLAVRRALVRAAHPAGQFGAARRRRQVVLQVDAEELPVHAGRSLPEWRAKASSSARWPTPAEPTRRANGGRGCASCCAA